MRGEQRAVLAYLVRCGGSPPLARGTDRGSHHAHGRDGITPACAGNRLPLSSGSEIVWDHPRLRGEQATLCIMVMLTWGSPPLARGTVLLRLDLSVIIRITPACAGNSQNPTFSLRAFRDHPRLRGEQHSFSLPAHSHMGSPPLARGTVDASPLIAPPFGITPACAGNRATAAIVMAQGEDHPRLRGEQL